MTKNKILKSNKIIATFMGWKVSKLHHEFNVCDEENQIWSDGKNARMLSSLKYHSDYSLLMAVVEKIEESGYTVKIEGKSCTIVPNTPPLWVIVKVEKNKKESIHEAVIELLKLNKKL